MLGEGGIGQSESGHRLDDGNGTGEHTGIVAASRLEGGGGAIVGDGLLWEADG